MEDISPARLAQIRSDPDVQPKNWLGDDAKPNHHFQDGYTTQFQYKGLRVVANPTKEWRDYQNSTSIPGNDYVLDPPIRGAWVRFQVPCATARWYFGNDGHLIDTEARKIVGTRVVGMPLSLSETLRRIVASKGKKPTYNQERGNNQPGYRKDWAEIIANYDFNINKANNVAGWDQVEAS